MKKVFVRLLFFLVIGILIYCVGLKHSAPVEHVIEQKRPDLTGIFNNGKYTQYIDPFGTVARTAFDASGKRIGTQVGTYRRGAPNGMVVEMTYLEPDADHPLGQAFDGAGNPMQLHTGPDQPIDRTERAPLVS
jgi:YD repeat-containing protein